jgi:proline iminopeptidase
MLWTATDGRGQPMVLSHGGPGVWDYLRPLADMVPDLAEVHRWDQRGCGRSSVVGPYTIARCVADVDVLRGAFGHERWVVAGHSWGARLALHYALEHPRRTAALMLVSGFGVGSDWRATYYAERLRRMTTDQRTRYVALEGNPQRNPDEEREFLMLSWSTDYADPSGAADIVRRMLDDGFAVNYECNQAINAEVRACSEDDMLARCRSLTVPVLVLHGAADPRPAWSTDSLLAALPNAQRVIIDGAGHFPWVERPDECGAALRQFLLALG